MRQMRDEFRGEIQTLGEQGRRQDQQATGQVLVKQIGDIHRTLRSICWAPDLSHANLADFDLWSQEMMHAIEAARTKEGQYNQVNIEFIYRSIELELRSQAEGHVPSKMEYINLMTPAAYLLELEKLYTPADHLSTKRSEFEGQRQLPTESPMAYQASIVPIVHQSQVQ